MLSKLLCRQGIRDLFFGCGLLSCILFLLLFPTEAIAAAKEGLGLCGNVIIPSLFPFFVLSSLAVDLGLATYPGKLLSPVMRPLFRVPGEGAAALILGLIGGYPVGARTTLSLYETGRCSAAEAERMLAFCNNSGPAFILGVVGAGVFSNSRAGLLLYCTHAAASVCVGLVFRFYRTDRRSAKKDFSPPPHFSSLRFSVAFTGAVARALTSTLNICAFVLFFTVFIRLISLAGFLSLLGGLLGYLLSPFGFPPHWGEKLLIGAIELSGGVWSLSGGGSNQLGLAAFMLGWAGFSVHCQVLSFMGESDLSVRPYFIGKLLHGLFSSLFISLFTRFFPIHIQASSVFVEQVENLTRMDFSTMLFLSTSAACLLWLLFFLPTAAAIYKNSRKRRKKMLY